MNPSARLYQNGGPAKVWNHSHLTFEDIAEKNKKDARNQNKLRKWRIRPCVRIDWNAKAKTHHHNSVSTMQTSLDISAS